MISTTGSLKSFRRSVEPFRYTQLSPRTLSFKDEASQVIKLQECVDIKNVKPNMELRKQLIKLNKSESFKDNVYLRSQRWKQEIAKKLSGIKWDLQVSEMSSCTFAPSLNRASGPRRKSNRKH